MSTRNPRRPRALPARDVTALAHDWIAPALATGGLAVDATTGRGRDTRFLAAAVGAGGRVHAFDIQRGAIEHARAALTATGLAARVRWHLDCHSRADRYLPGRELDAVMFNLGWLPGGDQARVTQPATTTAALSALLARLRRGGRVAVVAYRGHVGGPAEDRAVQAWLDAQGRAVRRLVQRAASPSPLAPVLRVFERA